MKKIIGWVAVVLLLTTTVLGQSAQKGKTERPAAAAPSGKVPNNVDLNLRAYIELLRSDVRKQKAVIIGEVMQFDAEDAAKFWPIYKEYEAELTRGGDTRLALVKKYADNYENMTDAIADELVSGALRLEQERHDLKLKYYERFKQAVGTITAARFLQVENQLLMLLDLQVAASLPVVK
ncbi:MAG: hypothetical protein U0V70_05025 [Terriglobia bacterium]